MHDEGAKDLVHPLQTGATSGRFRPQRTPVFLLQAIRRVRLRDRVRVPRPRSRRRCTARNGVALVQGVLGILVGTLVLSCSEPKVTDDLAAAASRTKNLTQLFTGPSRAARLEGSTVRAEARVLHWPCGCGIRPYIYATRPELGTMFRLVFDPFGLPVAAGRYRWPPTWIIVSSRLLPKPVPLSGECNLWLSIAPTDALVWGLEGGDLNVDALLRKHNNGRNAELRFELPDDPTLAGLQTYAQMVIFEGGELKSSQVFRFTVGTYP